MFNLNDSTTVDDVIEHLIERLNTDFLGSYLEVNQFCHHSDESQPHEFDKQIEMLVKDKILQYNATFVYCLKKIKNIFKINLWVDYSSLLV